MIGAATLPKKNHKQYFSTRRRIKGRGRKKNKTKDGKKGQKRFLLDNMLCSNFQKGDYNAARTITSHKTDHSTLPILPSVDEQEMWLLKTHTNPA